MASGTRSVALGINDIPKPTGICTNPVPERLAEKIKEDPDNPIKRCVFCQGIDMCYFAGECENKEVYTNEPTKSL